MKKAFLIIVNFNGGEEIASCLKSIKKKNVEAVVVDNGSTDGSLETIKKYPVKLIKNKKNLGFAAAANIGILYALKNSPRAVILLNSDAVIKKDFIKSLIENNADIASPIIEFKRNGKTVYDLGGKVDLVFGRSFHQESKRIFQPREIDYVSGCCMRIKPDVFDKVGLFDERFFLYWEDIDFCLRAKGAGLRINIEPGSKIFHQLKEGKKKSWFKIFHLLRGNLIFINRYIPFWRRWLAYLYWLMLSVKMVISKLI